jgi:predicted RNA binding protein YcfA (HicA-like mRNA interferase family)
MAFPKRIWDQLKNLTADDLIGSLRKDGWRPEAARGAILAFIKETGGGRTRVTIHYHPGKTYGPKLLQGLIGDIGWNEADLRRLKLIK